MGKPSFYMQNLEEMKPLRKSSSVSHYSFIIFMAFTIVYYHGNRVHRSPMPKIPFRTKGL